MVLPWRMVKNKLAQVIFQVVYCVLGVLGVFGSFGYFKGTFSNNFYVYYTNLSNYICLGFMVAALIVTIRRANLGERGAVNLAPAFNFWCVIMILVTCLVYNFLLAGDMTPAQYWLTFHNVLLHLVLPIMFIVHWAVFCEHRRLRWFDPLLCTVMPLVYVVIILIRSVIMHNVAGALLYPYFFLDVGKLGWGGVIGWVCALLVAFVAIGYLFFALDHWQTIRQKLGKVKSEK